MKKFIIEGGCPLHGTVKIQGSKNATLPILAATLLTEEPCTLTNVPEISDVYAFVNILKDLGSQITFQKNKITILSNQLRSTNISSELVKQMRASILLLAPLLVRNQKFIMDFPGGCVLGKRSIHAHTHALESLGAKITERASKLESQVTTFKGANFTMSEASVTATENAIMAAVTASGVTEIKWAAMEPHVQDLCHFLAKMGAKIQGIGSPHLYIEGVKKLKGVSYKITSDYLAAGTLALASILTQGEVTLEDLNPNHLSSFWEKLEEVGVNLKLTKSSATFFPLPKFDHLQAINHLKTAVYPGFATDLQAPFAVLLTQAKGESRIFETLFEGRLGYLNELEKMGAKITINNPQQATIFGPTALNATTITSCDIRAGAAMVLAALIAEGKTEINDIRYIDRGYENLDQTLNHLGAKITRQEI